MPVENPEQGQTDDYMALLRAARKASGISLSEMAERMGTTPEEVARLEEPGSDPRMSTLRRYCLAAGLLVEHEVVPLEET